MRKFIPISGDNGETCRCAPGRPGSATLDHEDWSPGWPAPASGGFQYFRVDVASGCGLGFRKWLSLSDADMIEDAVQLLGVANSSRLPSLRKEFKAPDAERIADFDHRLR